MENKLREIIKKQFALSDTEVAILISRAPVSYKGYRIKKKNGGHRKIHQPAREIKALQRWALDAVFSKLKVHPSSTAYEPGSSIKENANRHVNNDYFIKLDFKDFFHSIKSEDIVQFLSDKGIKLNSKDLTDLVRILCIKHEDSLCLSIGAPSSPKVSNVILYDFDEKVTSWCNENNVTYTRYADDLTFSTKQKNMGHLIEERILKIIYDMNYPKLELNISKRVSVSKKDWVSITGVTITCQKTLSVGRRRKRFVKSMIYKHMSEGLKQHNLSELNGLIAFIEHIEPGFKRKMIEKYGNVAGLNLKKESDEDPEI
ncbi:retron St85 family RNA-directed DNA polymerase [Vreelandella neptunia]|uniref:RNA-directed DNA polymerase n=1 Tax=Vreelandella neptunia TaxID=115551 RepID=A0ABS9S8Q8_9GAMM|nr:retron St85 family RNA-directed DNA polymerase [Halomonas neptunia]MCH4812479.1 retron St85 family RNA-directed DNA polymerase [Halomonas neptunia]TDV99901.1 reverse transcriptase (RNA-dependent DNA polymerase) [Halomonas alkaliantarctica]